MHFENCKDCGLLVKVRTLSLPEPVAVHTVGECHDARTRNMRTVGSMYVQEVGPLTPALQSEVDLLLYIKHINRGSK